MPLNNSTKPHHQVDGIEEQYPTMKQHIGSGVTCCIIKEHVASPDYNGAEGILA